MATLQKAWLKRMRSPISAMMNCIRDLAFVDLPHASLSSILSRMSTLRSLLLKNLTWAPQQLYNHSTPTQREYGLLISDLSKVITAVVPQLNRLGLRLNLPGPASSIGTPEEAVFWELWFFVAAGCSAVEAGRPIWLDLWQRDRHALHTHWYAAFHTLLSWLLPFSRSPAWRLMRQQHGVHKRNAALIAILWEPTHSINSMSGSALSTVFNNASALPADFVPLLCCIISEQLGNLPPVVLRTQPPAGTAATSCAQATSSADSLASSPDDRYASVHKIFDVLPNMIINFIYFLEEVGHLTHDADQTTNMNECVNFIETPAVLQCLKVGLVLRGQSPSTAESRRIIQDGAECLDLLFSGDVTVQPLSESNSELNSDALGLPLHLNPRISTVALETDTRLLHTLSTHIDRSQQTDAIRIAAVSCYSVQDRLVQRWAAEGELYPLPAAALRVMVRSVVGLAKQCSLHGLQLLKGSPLERQRPLQPGQGTLEEETSQLHRQQQRDGQLAITKPSVADPSLASLVRAVAFQASYFKINVPDDGLGSLSSPELKVLNTWIVTSGWAAATEVIHRIDMEPALQLKEILCALLVCGRSALVLSQSKVVPALGHHISLAATARKLFHTYTQSEQSKEIAIRQDQQGKTDVEQWQDKLQDCCNLRLLLLVSSSLMDAALGMDTLLAGASNCNGDGDGGSSSDLGSGGGGSMGSGGSSSSQRATKLDKDDGCDSRNHNLNSHITVNESTEASQASQHQHTGDGSMECRTNITALDRVSLNRLQVVLLVALAEVCRWVQECKLVLPEVDHQAWLIQLRKRCDQLHDCCLKSVVTWVLIKSDFPAPQLPSENSLMWENFALDRLQGRLLPGCCHLGCNNLGGVSEEALQTRLCGRCRRARYCSVECQKGAWLQGGHSNVCKGQLKCDSNLSASR